MITRAEGGILGKVELRFKGGADGADGGAGGGTMIEKAVALTLIRKLSALRMRDIFNCY